MRAVLTVLALLLGLISPVVAGPPTGEPSVVAHQDGRDVRKVPIDRFLLVLFRDSHPRIVCTSTCPAWCSYYAYCKGDPVNRMDPSGLDDIAVGEDGTIKWVPDDGSTPFIIGGGTPAGSAVTGISADLGGGTVAMQALKQVALESHLHLDANDIPGSVAQIGGATNRIVRQEVVQNILGNPGQFYHLMYQGHFPWEGAQSTRNDGAYDAIRQLQNRYSFGGRAPTGVLDLLSGYLDKVSSESVDGDISAATKSTLIGAFYDAATAFAATTEARANRGSPLVASNPMVTELLFKPKVVTPSTQLLLSAPGPRSVTLGDIQAARGRTAGLLGERLAEEMFGGVDQVRNPTKLGLRINDVVSAPIGTRIYLVESKAYQNEVPWSSDLQRQIWKDVLLRRGNRDFNPLYYFWNAPPSPSLMQSLRTANIPYVMFPPEAKPEKP